MKAPDKIYIPESKKVSGEVVVNIFNESPFIQYNSIAYIRKDALLEWTRTEQKKYRDDTQFDMGYLRAVNDLIKKLESL